MSNWYTVKELVHSEVLATPMDGNHGEIHPVAKDFMQAGVPFIMSSDINNGVVDYINCKFISKEHSLKLRKGFSKFGDVLLTHKASIGRTAINSYTDDEFIMLTPQVTYYRVINDHVLNSAFLKYYFNSSFFQTTIKAWSDAGSTRAYIGITKQLDLPIFVPAIQQQRQIAAVLSALDDKIEINNQINAELEAMAKTLYDYWFVQFDFPDAEGKPYKSSGGEMVYSEVLKREIPEGWEFKRLHEIANITMGQSPSGESYNEDQQGMIFFQGSTDFGWRFPENRIYTTAPTRFAKENDILLSVRAPIGTMNIAMSDCCIGRGLSALNSKENYNSFLIYQMNYFKKKFDYLNSVGTTFGSLTKDDLYNLELCFPPKDILEKFEKIVSQFDAKIKINTKQNQELAQLRDWLLPMLMNGQVTVGGLEEKLGMVAEEKSTYLKTNIQ